MLYSDQTNRNRPTVVCRSGIVFRHDVWAEFRQPLRHVERYAANRRSP